ncbi:MAG: molybdopterin molybdotransferase MoeA [Alphaproteobacteria bacterium]|nr:molybdopterin molybdotransferase MoeA [Alphaproteobacteria bacterium]
MLSVAEARMRMLASVTPLPAQPVALADAGGRVLFAPIIAKVTQPPLSVSAMDGYAVRGADCLTTPTRLTVTAEIPAGRMAPGPLRSGEAHRIFTGAPLPEGADAIVLQEDTVREGDIVVVRERVEVGRHIRRAGIDFSAGDVVLAPPLRLTGRHIALAAASGHGHVTVARRPRVAILSTGDELVPPGAPPGPAQITASTGPGLGALLSAWGAAVHDLGIARDNAPALSASLPRPSSFDLLITLGGASVGDHDLVRETLAALGFTLDFWRVALQPGKPLLFGQWERMPVIGLPGNPVSAFVCAHLFVRPFLDRMQGLPGEPPVTARAVLGCALGANGSREQYLRAHIETDADQQWIVTPDARQDSSLLSVLAQSNALLVRPPHAPAAPAGAKVRVILFE